MAALSFDVSVPIQAPAKQIYAYVSDFPRHREWNHSPQEIESLTDGPIGVGSRFRTRESLPGEISIGSKVMLGLTIKLAEWRYGAEPFTMAEITTMEPDARFAWKAWAPTKRGNDMIRMTWELQLTPQHGATLVTQRCDVAPPEGSPMARFVNDDMRKQLAREAEANLQRLKQIVEAAGPS